MKTDSFLNADMATITRQLHAGFDWWVDTLVSMLPLPLRQQATRLKRYVAYHADGTLTMVLPGSHQRLTAPPTSSLRNVPISISGDLCLVRPVTLPMLRRKDLERLAEMDAERIMPMPAAAMLTALSLRARNEAARSQNVDIAGLPRKTAEAALDAAAQFGITPERVVLLNEEQAGSIAFDFTRAVCAATLLPKPSHIARVWWCIVAALCAFNIAVLVWRDNEQIAALQQRIEAQAPAVNTAKIILKRIEAGRNTAVQVYTMRQRQDAVATLADITTAFPQHAWIQRLQWDGRAMRLTGYRRQDADVLGAMRKLPRFTKIRAVNDEVTAELPTGQPFDISATIGGGSK